MIKRFTTSRLLYFTLFTSFCYTDWTSYYPMIPRPRPLTTFMLLTTSRIDPYIPLEDITLVLIN